MTPISQPIDEPKTESLSVKVTKSTKIEFEAEARNMGLDNSKYLLLFVDSRHELIKLLQEGGIRLDLDEELEVQLAALAEHRGTSLIELIEAICLEHIGNKRDMLEVINASKNYNNVNPFQSIDLQRDTQVNGNVNGSVNGRIPTNTQENTERVNATKRIDELANQILFTLKISSVLVNVSNLINYVINERRTFSNFSRDELEQVVFEGLTDFDIQFIKELGRISNHNP
ncbi:hypothetical protein LV89_01810 [Arcicella aurantiaca]|uniref:Uncharacterized protein n=1 Tax=Arcicella aurantiaca TaxID=591202 RepID=A0A316EBP0_9BACT|nr:hypothetical protein [Arcicella aurantiaca]PWK26998.1 hypothetical protein LV89_01810 [Arcicella aurantiaca]